MCACVHLCDWCVAVLHHWYSMSTPSHFFLSPHPCSLLTSLSSIHPPPPPPPPLKVSLSLLNEWSDLQTTMQYYMSQYQEEHGVLDITLSSIAIKHLVRLHRAIVSSRYSNMLTWISAIQYIKHSLLKSCMTRTICIQC